MNWNTFALWRALHVVAVIFWIGGVAFVTTVLIPSLRRRNDDYSTFELLEHQFGTQAKITTQLTLISGIGMLWITNGWARLLDTWWLWPMILTWFVFTLMLFILEPIVIHKILHNRSKKDSSGTLKLLQRLHYFLLGLGLLATLAGVIGAHGGAWFN